MVGAVRFELTTSCTRNKRASQATLRPEPELLVCGAPGEKANMNLPNFETNTFGSTGWLIGSHKGARAGRTANGRQ